MWYQRKGSKYGAVRTTFNGHKFDSKKEAQHAAELDLLKKAGEIKSWTPQYKMGLSINNQHFCNIFVDFLVVNPDNSKELHEVKSKPTMTSTWRLKWRAAKILYSKDYKFIVIE